MYRKWVYIHMITASDQGAVVTVNGGESWSSWYNQPTGQFYHLQVPIEVFMFHLTTVKIGNHFL
ncbi:MAG: hypothetical protein ACYCVH_14605 [Ignavibacteriaceae bacterium]